MPSFRDFRMRTDPGQQVDRHLEQWQKVWLFSGYTGDEQLPSYVGIILFYTIIRIPFKQPLWWWLWWNIRPGFFFVAHFVSPVLIAFQLERNTEGGFYCIQSVWLRPVLELLRGKILVGQLGYGVLGHCHMSKIFKNSGCFIWFIDCLWLILAYQNDSAEVVVVVVVVVVVPRFWVLKSMRLWMKWTGPTSDSPWCIILIKPKEWLNSSKRTCEGVELFHWCWILKNGRSGTLWSDWFAKIMVFEQIFEILVQITF